jgi:hypothetical protein
MERLVSYFMDADKLAAAVLATVILFAIDFSRF